MDNNCFAFLKDDFQDIYKYCQKAEISFVKHEYVDSINNAGKALEGLTLEIGEREGVKYDYEGNDYINANLYNRIRTLHGSKFLSDDEKDLFHKIRLSRNKGSHFDDNELINPQKSAMCAHEYLYNLIEKSVDETGYVLDNATPNLSSLRRRLNQIDIRIKNKLTRKQYFEKFNYVKWLNVKQ